MKKCLAILCLVVALATRVATAQKATAAPRSLFELRQL